MATRYKVTKEQLEMIVENFVMEAATETKKASVKNMIPSQSADAKKHVKNKMSGNMVDQSEGMPSVTPMKKKLSQASDAKKHMSKGMAKHTNKAKTMKESILLDEGLWDTFKQKAGEFFGTRMDPKDAEEIYARLYRKMEGKMAEELNTTPEAFKAAVMDFLVKRGGYAVFGGKGKNAEWDPNLKWKDKAGVEHIGGLKTLSSKLGGPTSGSQALAG